MQQLHPLLQFRPLSVREIGVLQGGLVGEAIPRVGHHTAVSQPDLERSRSRPRPLPARIFLVRRDIRLALSPFRPGEFHRQQAGLGRHLLGCDDNPARLAPRLLALPVILRQGDRRILLRAGRFTKAVAVGQVVDRQGGRERTPRQRDLLLARSIGGIDLPGRPSLAFERVECGGVRVDLARCHRAPIEPRLHTAPQGGLFVGSHPMDQRRVSTGSLGKPGRGHAGVGHPLRILTDVGGNVLRLHLYRLVGLGGTRIEKQPRQVRLVDGRPRPEVREEERHRAFEIAGVEKECPAIRTRRHRCPGGDLLGCRQWQGEVAIAEELARRSLFQVQTIGRPEHPRTELGDGVMTSRLTPVAPLPGPGTIGPLDKFQGDATHDELGSLGGEPGVAPPAEASFDIGVDLPRGLGFMLGEHPGPEEPALKILPWIVFQQGPRGNIHREARVVLLLNPAMGDEQVARHLGRARRGLGERLSDLPQPESAKQKAAEDPHQKGTATVRHRQAHEVV